MRVLEARIGVSQSLIDVSHSGLANGLNQLRTEIGYLWIHRDYRYYVRSLDSDRPIGRSTVERKVRQTSNRRPVPAGVQWTKAYANVMLDSGRILTLAVDRERSQGQSMGRCELPQIKTHTADSSLP